VVTNGATLVCCAQLRKIEVNWSNAKLEYVVRPLIAGEFEAGDLKSATAENSGVTISTPDESKPCFSISI
jgi:hypothetical protein